MEQKLFTDFIEALNKMDLKGGDLYKQYAIMKNAVTVIGERTNELKEYIVDDMKIRGEDKLDLGFGKFTVFDSSEYRYTPEVEAKEKELKALKDIIKSMKEYEEATKKAELVEEKKTLRFT